MDHNKKLQLEGHSQGVRSAYTSQEVELLRELYKSAYQYLDLSEEAAAESKVKELEKIVEEQRKQIGTLNSRLEEAERTADRVTALEEAFFRDMGRAAGSNLTPVEKEKKEQG